MDLIYDDIELHIDVPVTQVNNQDKDVILDSDSIVTVLPDQGYTGLSSVEITPVLQSKIGSVTANGQYVYQPNLGFCGMDSCIVDVNVVASPTYWLLKNVEFDMSQIETVVYSIGSLVSVGASNTFTASINSQRIYIFVFGKYASTSPGRRNVSRLSYIIVRNDSGSPQSVSYSTLFGYQPDFYHSYPCVVSDFYPTYTYDNAANMFSHIFFHFSKYNSSFVEQSENQSVRVKRTVDFTTYGYQAGDIISLNSSGIF